MSAGRRSDSPATRGAACREVPSAFHHRQRRAPLENYVALVLRAPHDVRISLVDVRVEGVEHRLKIEIHTEVFIKWRENVTFRRERLDVTLVEHHKRTGHDRLAMRWVVEVDVVRRMRQDDMHLRARLADAIEFAQTVEKRFTRLNVLQHMLGI